MIWPVYQTKLCFQLCKQTHLSSVSAAVKLLLPWVLCLLYTALWLWVVPGYVTPSERKKELCTLLNSDIWHLPFLLLFLYTIYTCLADECIVFGNPFVSLWVWTHFLIDKLCICKKLMLATGVLQDQLLILSFFTVACTWQITLKSCFHNLLCLVVLHCSDIYGCLRKKKRFVIPRMTDKQLFCKCL